MKINVKIKKKKSKTLLSRVGILILNVSADDEGNSSFENVTEILRYLNKIYSCICKINSQKFFFYNTITHFTDNLRNINLDFQRFAASSRHLKHL